MRSLHRPLTLSSARYDDTPIEASLGALPSARCDLAPPCSTTTCSLCPRPISFFLCCVFALTALALEALLPAQPVKLAHWQGISLRLVHSKECKMGHVLWQRGLANNSCRVRIWTGSLSAALYGYKMHSVFV